MKQSFWAAPVGLSCAALIAAPVFARAMMIAPPSVPQRVAVADVIVVGKVTAFGDHLVQAVPPTGGDKKVDYPIAIVHRSDSIAGVGDAKEIKVGFIPPPPPTPPGAGPGPRPFIKHYPQFNLSLDEEACLFLVKHPTEDFYVGQAYYDVLNKAGYANFDKDMDEVKRCVTLLADPAAGLQGKNADDRYLTAALLVLRYRTRKPGETKTAPIDAGQSKQILLALADADWDPKPGGPAGFRMSPQFLFASIGPTAEDGWVQPKDVKETAAAAKQWLKDNAEKYRIRRYVAEKQEDK